MSILDVAAGSGSTVSKARVPQHYRAVRSAVHDESTGRTYQLCERDDSAASAAVPFCVSAAGNHADALLDILNRTRALSFKRDALKDAKQPREIAQRDALSAEIKALPNVSVERTDRTTRMLIVYGERGIE